MMLLLSLALQIMTTEARPDGWYVFMDRGFVSSTSSPPCAYSIIGKVQAAARGQWSLQDSPVSDNEAAFALWPKAEALRADAVIQVSVKKPPVFIGIWKPRSVAGVAIRFTDRSCIPAPRPPLRPVTPSDPIVARLKTPEPSNNASPKP